jgi:hypothetical protein
LLYFRRENSLIATAVRTSNLTYLGYRCDKEI